MTCAKITATDFKAARPQFVGVDNAVVGRYIDLAQVWASNWPEELCEWIQEAVVCHLMTLDGLGNDKESKAFASGLADMQSIHSGAITLTRFKSASEGAGQSTTGWFRQTACGRMFLTLTRGVVGGPRIAGEVGRPVTAYAKDAWW